MWMETKKSNNSIMEDTEEPDENLGYGPIKAHAFPINPQYIGPRSRTVERVKTEYVNRK